MLKRVPIPVSIEERVLFDSDHTCCICRTKGKDVQIHHVDGKRDNNVAENLAVLCLDCHSRVSGSRGLGKQYKAGEVRRYKRAWEKFVEGTRRIHNPKIGYKKELVSQIDLIVCEILASKNDIRRVRSLLQVLYELRVWRGGPEVNKKIIEGLEQDALNTLFFFTCGHGHRQKNIRKIVLSAEQFFQIGLWYSNRKG